VRLYNLKLDPYEKNEVSNENLEVIKRIKNEIHNWHPVQKE